MKYDKLVAKIKKDGSCFSGDVSGVQLFMLIYDGVIQVVNYEGNFLAVKMTPVEASDMKDVGCLIIVNDETAKTYEDGLALLKKAYKFTRTSNAYIDLEDELFQIEFEA